MDFTDPGDMFKTEPDALRFQSQIITDDKSVVMSLRERRTGQERTVVVAIDTCSGCGKVHMVPVSMLLDHVTDVRRFDPPFGAEIGWDHA